jgi:predicted enzyme related to lactoylglutathione lyase
MSPNDTLVTGVDFVTIPTRDIDATVEFYGTTLGLRRSTFVKERGFAEFETGNLTLDVIEPDKMGMEYRVNTSTIALHVEDVALARAQLEARGVAFNGEILDTGVCHMAFFADPAGNPLMLHHRYAPRVTDA